jgi:hypothetical protein
MISKLFKLGAVETPSGQVNQITSQSINPGVETILHCGDGQVDYTFAGVLAQEPVVTFSTTAIARALGFIGINALSVAASNVDFWFQKAQAGGTRLTGSNSTRFRATNGILHPTTLQAGDRSLASLGYSMSCVSSDGSTSPLSVALLQAMPSNVATRELFVAGPVAFNGTTIEGIQSITIDFGLRIVTRGGDGEAYPTFTYLDQRKPMITARCKNVDIASTIGFFAPQGATDSVVYLRKLAEGGTRVANGTAEHVKFTIDAGMISCRELSGDEADEANAEIVIEPTFDGTNDVIAVSTASAIS